METLGFIIFIGVLVVWGFINNQRSEKKEELVASGVLDPYRDFMASTVPALMQEFNVFTPEYLQKYADQFSRDGSTALYTKEDILSGTEIDPRWVVSHCASIAAARYHNMGLLKDAEEAGLDVELKIGRSCPGCPHVPVEKVYKPGKAPVYPCADCKEEQACDIWYKVLS